MLKQSIENLNIGHIKIIQTCQHTKSLRKEYNINTETERGHFGVTWQNEHRLLPYVRPVLSTEAIANFHNAGYLTNSAINFAVEEYNEPTVPKWANDIGRVFGLFEQGLKFIRLSQYDVIPPHTISITNYCLENKADPEDVMHGVLFLEDWQPGQLLEIDGIPHTNWNKGDWFKFWADRPISYANVGKKKMYMVQLIGKEAFTGQLEHLFSLNMPGQHDKPELSHPFIQQSIMPLINPVRDQQQHDMVYMHNGYITELDEIEHDQAGVDKINRYGMTIWLFEPMCSYYEGEEFTQGFYSEFPYPEDKNRMRSKELDAIQRYQHRNGIEPYMVKVNSGEYGIKESYPHYNTLTLECKDLYVMSQRPIIGLGALIKQDFHKHKFSKHFISLNWRFTKHRQIIANFLAGENGYLSWYFSDSFDVVKDKLYFDIEAWQYSSPEVFKQLHDNTAICQQNSPYTVDKPSDLGINSEDSIWPSVAEYKDGQTPSLYNTKETMLANFYRDVFVDIVTETRFAQSCANYSEKVLQPMQYLKPFILVAPPYTLKYIKESGYQTFDQFWDESYDTIEDHGERLKKILELIKSILDKSLPELHNLYEQMMPILAHNRQTYLELTWSPNFDDSEFHA